MSDFLISESLKGRLDEDVLFQQEERLDHLPKIRVVASEHVLEGDLVKITWQRGEVQEVVLRVSMEDCQPLLEGIRTLDILVNLIPEADLPWTHLGVFTGSFQLSEPSIGKVILTVTKQ